MKTIEKNLEVKVIIGDDGTVSYEVYEPESGCFEEISGTISDGQIDDQVRSGLVNELASWASIMTDELEELKSEEEEDAQIVNRCRWSEGRQCLLACGKCVCRGTEAEQAECAYIS